MPPKSPKKKRQPILASVARAPKCMEDSRYEQALKSIQEAISTQHLDPAEKSAVSLLELFLIGSSHRKIGSDLDILTSTTEEIEQSIKVVKAQKERLNRFSNEKAQTSHYEIFKQYYDSLPHNSIVRTLARLCYFSDAKISFAYNKPSHAVIKILLNTIEVEFILRNPSPSLDNSSGSVIIEHAKHVYATINLLYWNIRTMTYVHCSDTAWSDIDDKILRPTENIEEKLNHDTTLYFHFLRISIQEKYTPTPELITLLIAFKERSLCVALTDLNASRLSYEKIHLFCSGYAWTTLNHLKEYGKIEYLFPALSSKNKTEYMAVYGLIITIAKICDAFFNHRHADAHYPHEIARYFESMMIDMTTARFLMLCLFDYAAAYQEECKDQELSIYNPAAPHIFYQYIKYLSTIKSFYHSIYENYTTKLYDDEEHTVTLETLVEPVVLQPIKISSYYDIFKDDDDNISITDEKSDATEHETLETSCVSLSSVDIDAENSYRQGLKFLKGNQFFDARQAFKLAARNSCIKERLILATTPAVPSHDSLSLLHIALIFDACDDIENAIRYYHQFFQRYECENLQKDNASVYDFSFIYLALFQCYYTLYTQTEKEVFLINANKYYRESRLNPSVQLSIKECFPHDFQSFGRYQTPSFEAQVAEAEDNFKQGRYFVAMESYREAIDLSTLEDVYEIHKKIFFCYFLSKNYYACVIMLEILYQSGNGLFIKDKRNHFLIEKIIKSCLRKKDISDIQDDILNKIKVAKILFKLKREEDSFEFIHRSNELLRSALKQRRLGAAEYSELKNLYNELASACLSFTEILRSQDVEQAIKLQIHITSYGLALEHYSLAGNVIEKKKTEKKLAIARRCFSQYQQSDIKPSSILKPTLSTENIVEIIQNENHKEACDQLTRYQETQEKELRQSFIACVSLAIQHLESTKRSAKSILSTQHTTLQLAILHSLLKNNNGAKSAIVYYRGFFTLLNQTLIDETASEETPIDFSFIYAELHKLFNFLGNFEDEKLVEHEIKLRASDSKVKSELSKKEPLDFNQCFQYGYYLLAITTLELNEAKGISSASVPKMHIDRCYRHAGKSLPARAEAATDETIAQPLTGAPLNFFKQASCEIPSDNAYRHDNGPG